MAKQQKKGLSIEELRIQNNYEPSPEGIGFLGRAEEMQEIDKFLKSSKRILEIVGVPMIGKTALTKEYCKLNKIKHIRIVFRQNPYTPFDDLEEQLFGKGKFNDFSGIENGTLLIIENFEQALHWTAQDDNLHQITGKGITEFLNRLVEKECKLLIETRFQIRFDKDFQKYFVQTLPLKGIDTTLFWEYYANKNFTDKQFANLCQKFNNHTGLLALAYNDAEWLYENELLKAIYEPTSTSKSLWKLLEVIIKKLDTAEKQILAALTLWQNAIEKDKLKEVLQGHFIGNFDKTLESLKKKLLVFSSIKDQDLAYALNPYLAEVFFAFMENSAEMAEIRNMTAFQRVRRSDSNEIELSYTKGDYKTFFGWVKDKRKAGKYEEVITMLQSVYWQAPKPEVILNEIGVTYKWQKKYKEAKEVLQKACDLGNIQSFNELAIVYKAEGNFEVAKKVLEKALAIEPKNVRVLNELGIVYKEQGNFEEAKKVLLKALAINDKDVKTLNELGIVYKGQGNFEEAEKVLQKAIALGNIQSFNELGIIYKQEGNFEEAKKVLLKALAIEPNNVKVLNELGIVYKEEGNFEEAKKVLLKALAIEPNNVRVLNELAIVYKQEGNFEVAKKVLLKACELGNIQSFNELAMVYKAQGNFEEAKKVLLKALAIEPNNVKVLNELGIVYKEEGNFEEAKKVLLKALAIEPNNVRVLNELAIVYKEQGNFAKAIEIVEKGQRIAPNDRYLSITKMNILKAHKEYQTFHPTIQQALAALQNENYSGYFEEMDKIIMNDLKSEYFELKNNFITGTYPNNFYRQLERFATLLNNSLPKNAIMLDTDAKKLQLISRLYEQNIDIEEKKDTLEYLLKIEPNNFKFLNELATIYKTQGNSQKYRELLETALKNQID